MSLLRIAYDQGGSVATLSGGASKIIRPLMSGDGASAINAAKSMGAKVEEKGDTLLITGIGTPMTSDR